MALFNRAAHRAAGIYPQIVDAQLGRADHAVPLCAVDGADGLQLQRQQTQRDLEGLHPEILREGAEQRLAGRGNGQFAHHCLSGHHRKPGHWRAGRLSCCGGSAFPFKGVVEGTMSLPIIVPEICLGRCVPDLLCQGRLANRSALAAQSVRDHHRPHHLLLSRS